MPTFQEKKDAKELQEIMEEDQIDRASRSKPSSKSVSSSSLVGRTIEGVASKIKDGDTFVLTYGPDKDERIDIRVLNLECPEKGEPTYKYCTDIARSLIEGERVEVYIDSEDSFGRYLGRVRFSRGDFADAMKDATRGECH